MENKRQSIIMNHGIILEVIRVQIQSDIDSTFSSQNYLIQLDQEGIFERQSKYYIITKARLSVSPLVKLFDRSKMSSSEQLHFSLSFFILWGVF